jgi:hypothetical protein
MRTAFAASFALSWLSPLAPPQTADELFVEIPGADAVLASSDPTTAAEAIGMFRLDLLDDLAESGGSRRVALDLLGAGRALIAFESREDLGGDASIWRGRVLGDEHGSAVVSLAGDVAVGTVRANGQLLRISYAGRGLHALARVDEARFPACALGSAEEIECATPQMPPSSGAIAPRAAGSAGPTIDVLVVYTPDARAAEGGTSAIEAKINLAVAETNTAYQQSQVDQRLRLVHQEELAGYAETGDFGTELGRLRDPNDGWFDHVHALRDQYAADAVAMIVAGTQYCGIGYLMQTVSPAFEANAFSVTSRVCATGYYSFAHELGHNMGCHHDRANASTGAYPYSYGYRTANGAWRTIMAYAPGTRIQYFSNPNVSYSGQALGVPDPSPSSAENWKTLNNTAATFAQFRCAIPAPYGAGKLTSIGTTPVLSWSGSPSVIADDLALEIDGGMPFASVIAFYGFAQGNSPWNGGTLYVAGTKKRLPIESFDAAGGVSIDFPSSLFASGDTIYCQGWFRDPAHPDGTTVGLTNGLRVDFCD